jgi:hypothetical protein
MNIDPEILNEFRAESKGLLEELQGVVEKLEETEATSVFPEALLTEFAQKIDRIMGAVKTMALLEPGHEGFISIGKLAELCKSIGYKAAEKKNTAMLPIFSAFWADTIEVIESLLKCIESPEETHKIAQSFPPVLAQRLAWLKSKIEA